MTERIYMSKVQGKKFKGRKKVEEMVLKKHWIPGA